MAVCDVLNMSADKVGEIELRDDIFDVPVRVDVVHQVVCMQRQNRRAGNASTKTRGMVKGGGAKPWRQKGTGRARAGSRTSPVWRGGGTVFGPQPRSYKQKLPKKVRRLALKMALSARCQEGNLVVIDTFDLPEIKTRKFVEVMKNFGFENCLVVTPDIENQLQLSSRNAVGYQVLPVAGLNVYDILRYSKLMIVQQGLDTIEERLTA